MSQKCLTGTFAQAKQILINALVSGNLTASGVAPDSFMNSGWKTLQMKGTWIRDDEGYSHQIYMTTGWYSRNGIHFLNSGRNGNYSVSGMMFEVWYGKESSVPVQNPAIERNWDVRIETRNYTLIR